MWTPFGENGMMGISGKRVDFIDLYGKWMQGVLEKNKRKEN